MVKKKADKRNISKEILDLVEKKKRRKTDEDEEDYEEPEGSVPEDEEVWSDESDSDDGWKSDLMGDDADRKMLDSLSEIQREAILYDRAMIRQKKKETRDLKRQLRKKKNPTRQKLDKLVELKRMKKLRASIENELLNSSESEEEGEEKIAVVVEDIDVSDINRVCIPRRRVEQWIFRPFYEQLMVGSFVRVSIGSKEGSPVYRVCQVEEIVKYHRPYKLDTFFTDKALLLRYIKSTRTFRVDMLSNGPITKGEINRWKTEMKIAKLPLPTKDFLLAKENEITKAKNLPLTDVEISDMIKEKKKFQSGPRNFAVEKANLLDLLANAKAEENQDEITRINDELQLLEQDSEIDKKLSSDSKLDALALLNKRNREINQQEIREAEKKSMAKKKEQGLNALDPFARRKWKPDFAHSMPSTYAPVEEKKEAVAAVEKIAEKPKEKDLYSSHDFELDIDI